MHLFDARQLLDATTGRPVVAAPVQVLDPDTGEAVPVTDNTGAPTHLSTNHVGLAPQFFAEEPRVRLVTSWSNEIVVAAYGVPGPEGDKGDKGDPGGAITVSVDRGVGIIADAGTAAVVVSTDAGNLLEVGTDAGAYLDPGVLPVVPPVPAVAATPFVVRWQGAGWEYTSEAAATAAGLQTGQMAWFVGGPSAPSWARPGDVLSVG